MRIIIFTIFATIVCGFLSAQTVKLEWAKQVGMPFGNDHGRSIAIDAMENVYITGNFQGTVDFDPGVGTFNLTSAGNYDIFVLKLDSSGSFVWAKNMGGASMDEGDCIAVDAQGNVYTTGLFTSTADFDPGAGIFNLTSVGVLYNIFVSKLDSSGDFVWAKQISGNPSNRINSITVDTSGNVYMTGGFQDSVDFDLGLDTFNLIALAGSWDIFISKIDSAGDFVWARQIGGTDNDIGNYIALDASENVYTTGGFQDTVDFDPGVDAFNIASVGGSDIFVSKLNSSGNFLWAKQMGGMINEGGYSISVGASGNVYTTGNFQDTVDFDPGPGSFNLASFGTYNMFISKLDSSGNFLWAKQMGGTSSVRPTSIALDALENVYTTGFFEGIGDFDPDTGTFDLISAGGYDIFVSELDSSGNFFWARQMGGASTDYGNSLAVGASETVYTTGYFEGTVDFDPGPDISNLSSPWSRDVFILKMSSCKTTTSNLSDTVCYTYTVPSGHETYTISGTYTDTIPNIAGCDSILTINLAVNYTSSTITASVCTNFVVPSGDEVHYVSGVYMDTIPNSLGCDSLITINLTIGNTYDTLTVNTCDSYTSPSGSYTFTSSGTYSDTLANSQGCDSILSIALSIDTSYNYSITYDICNGDSFFVGGAYQTVPGSYTDSLQTSLGCDSVIITGLSVNSATGSNQVETICQGDSILLGGVYQMSPATYYDTFIGSNGCDSVVSTDLNVNSSYLINLSGADICQGDSIMLFGTFRNTAGTYYDSLNTLNFCDSVLSTTLTVNLLPIVSFSGLDTGYCSIDAGVTMTGTPSGGTFSGTGAVAASVFYPATGVNIYTVTYSSTDSLGCSNSSSQTVSVILCSVAISEEEHVAGNLKIYPNPNTGKFTIEATIVRAGNLKLTVLNSLGQKILVDKVFQKAGIYSLSLDLSEYGSGIYQVKLSNEGGEFQRQVIID